MPNVLKTVFSTPQMPRAPEPGTGGLTHFIREHDGRPIRYHLRVEPDGSGLLLANAAAAVRLSPTGIVIARALLETRDAEQAVAQTIADRFGGVPLERVQRDVATLRVVLDELANPRPGEHPLRNLDDPDATLHRRRLGAPLWGEVPP
jgi:hypothetical protein